MIDGDTPQGTVTETSPEVPPLSAPPSEEDITRALGDQDESSDTNEGDGFADEANSEDLDASNDAEENEQLVDDTEDLDENTDEQSEDGSDEELTGGRIAPHNAKVRLADGTLTTVKDLLDGGLRQSDYSRKTNVLAEDRKAFDQQQSRGNEATQAIQMQYERLNAMLGQLRPVMPTESALQDPAKFLKYQQDSANYEQWETAIQSEHAELTTRTQQDQQRNADERYQNEYQSLIQKMPALSDDVARQKFFDDAGSMMEEYNFSKDDIGGIGDHRFVLVMRDLMNLKKRAASAPQIKEKVQGKPKMLKSGKRNGKAPVQAARKQIRDRLRETGSQSDGVAAIALLND